MTSCNEKFGSPVKGLLESMGLIEGASVMASGRARSGAMWAGRLAALLVAVVIPACNSTAGPGSNKGPNLLWNSQAGSGITSSTGSAVTWVDPNTGLGGGTIGVVQIISSVDDATYAQFNVSTQPPPFNQWVAYISAVNHPQLYLAIGVPIVVNIAFNGTLAILLSSHFNARLAAMEKPFDEKLCRVEEVLARLNPIEDKLGIR